MTTRRLACAVLAGSLGLVGHATPSVAQAATQAPERLTVAGVNNFWRINKDVSTGGTITSRELAIPELKKRGIKTVINLAGGAEAEAEGAAARAAGLRYFVFAIDPMTLDPAPIDPFLKAAADPTIYPVFIHSGAGHRAAMAWMIKRVLLDGWTIERAGIEAAASGLVNDNEMAPRWWKFAQDYITSHKK